jgi:ferrous iron transport protein B
MDRGMRFIGLPGKSFIPLIVGFGCNVPAVMASRTLESQRDRFMTMAMAPFMSCGARLPVYALFAVAFFPQNGQNLVFLLYLIGIAAAVLTGLALKHTLMPGQGTPFVMELPAYHLPTVKGVLIHTWNRLSGFIFKAGKIIVPMVMILNILNATGTDGSFGKEDSADSLLAMVGKKITPLFSPFGVSEENWPAAVGIFTGVLAKEAVVGTLNALYEEVGKERREEEDPEAEEEPFAFWPALKDVAATVPAALGEISDQALDPLGISVGNTEDQEAAAEEQAVSVSTFAAMQNLFGSSAAAFSYLLLVLLYFPCVAVLGAIRQEAGFRWMLFVSAWSTFLGFTIATTCYQALTFSAHPASATAWIIGLPLALLGVLWSMGRYGKGQRLSILQQSPEAVAAA